MRATHLAQQISDDLLEFWLNAGLHARKFLFTQDSEQLGQALLDAIIVENEGDAITPGL